MYCTCSLLPEENQEQAAWFTATQPMFRALPLPDILPTDGILSPYRTGTDGFFVAVWERDSLNPTTAEA
jgi:16S rRNA (cytosine967-C5)-methyltransferase